MHTYRQSIMINTFEKYYTYNLILLHVQFERTRISNNSFSALNYLKKYLFCEKQYMLF